jgi:hypothetical protein
MIECPRLNDTDRLCRTLYPESYSLLLCLPESDTKSQEPKTSETGSLTNQLK